MSDIECEKVFLIKRLPSDILKYKSIFIQIGDFTLANDIDILKIRCKGDDCELIKKEYISEAERREYRIPLNKQEFDLLYPVAIRKHAKRRFFYPLGKYTCEIDVYLEDMLGYARAEVELDNPEEIKNFKCPDWFGNEITALNHEIHENLGTITFQTMVNRFKERGITLVPVYLPSGLTFSL